MAPVFRYVSFGFTAISAAAAATQPLSVAYVPPTQVAALGTTFVDWDSLAVRVTAVGQSRAVFDAPTPTLEKFEVHITTLNPGMISHPPHHHPWEEILLLREGDLQVSINGEKHHAGPGAFIFFAAHDVHNLMNVGLKPATYYVINFYTDVVRAIPDEAAAARSLPDRLASSVIDCDSLPRAPTKTGSRCKVVDSATLTFLRLESHITLLNAGESTLPDIRDPGDEFFVIKSGVVEAKVNQVTCRLNEGSCFYFAPNDGRAFKSIGPGPASYQVIKVVCDRSPKQL